jgi:hypothetical protein
MKSRRHSLSLFLVVSLSCCVLTAQSQAPSQTVMAAVPRLVNFSGRTADAQGKPIAGIAGVTFAIYKDQSEGAPLWFETQNVQADAKGNYTVHSPHLGSCCCGNFLVANSTATNRLAAEDALLFLFQCCFIRCRFSVPKLKLRFRQNSLRRMPLLTNSATNR